MQAMTSTYMYFLFMFQHSKFCLANRGLRVRALLSGYKYNRIYKHLPGYELTSPSGFWWKCCLCSDFDAIEVRVVWLLYIVLSEFLSGIQHIMVYSCNSCLLTESI